MLRRENYAWLHGRRVGLVTNHTGVNRDGNATVDLLHKAPGVHLHCLFSPEHGIRGALDENVPDGKDEITGLPVYSLYGARTKPSAAQLAGLDALVYDIQDIGARFYTYISTLGLCMEAAAQHNVAFLVLDRPNPIGGVAVEGCLADADKLSFTAYHPIPIRHGLTVGEMARLFHAEKKLGGHLDVVPVQGWKRATWWDATNLVWVHPSPNMRSLTQALLYPGICLLEPTNVSVGRGTDTPFEVIGAPWMEGRRVAAECRARDLPGVAFVPVRFTPHTSVHAHHACGGVNIIVTDRARFQPVLTGMTLAEIIYRLYPNAWEADKFNRLLVNDAAYHAFREGASAASLREGWASQVEAFRARRAPYLLYS